MDWIKAGHWEPFIAGEGADRTVFARPRLLAWRPERPSPIPGLRLNSPSYFYSSKRWIDEVGAAAGFRVYTVSDDEIAAFLLDAEHVSESWPEVRAIPPHVGHPVVGRLVELISRYGPLHSVPGLLNSRPCEPGEAWAPESASVNLENYIWALRDGVKIEKTKSWAKEYDLEGRRQAMLRLQPKVPDELKIATQFDEDGRLSFQPVPRTLSARVWLYQARSRSRPPAASCIECSKRFDIDVRPGPVPVRCSACRKAGPKQKRWRERQRGKR